MRITMRTVGVPELLAQLSHLGEKVPDSARKSMHRGADKIVEEARLNAPVDEGNLEQSIRKEVEYGYRGRLRIVIVMGGVVNGVNVDNYALEVHENYDGRHAGPNTIAKQTPAATSGRSSSSAPSSRSASA